MGERDSCEGRRGIGDRGKEGVVGGGDRGTRR